VRFAIRDEGGPCHCVTRYQSGRSERRTGDLQDSLGPGLNYHRTIVGVSVICYFDMCGMHQHTMID
jgi:hypothetical protein